MKPPRQWCVVLLAPGEQEIALLAELTARVNARVVAVIDSVGDAMGTAIAEVMGIPVFGDLSDPVIREAEYLIYPVGFPLTDFLKQQADQVGLTSISSREFRHRISRDVLSRRTAPHPPQNFESLERETETIHRTLSRIEEALQRESLLRWLLSLATRAVRATSGSIMLFDEKTHDLYIAFAYGLSESTLHVTRTGLGEGIAGRVAQQRRSELVQGRLDLEATAAADRPDIVAAISSPLTWEDELLGVLNVSVAEGDPDLTENDLATIDRLSRRISLILRRFLDIQRAQTGELFHSTDRDLQELMQKTEDFATVLSAWAGTLTLNLEAASCSLAVVCDDGTLLVAEGKQDGNTQVWYEATQNQAWNEVREQGAPLVVRQTDLTPADRGGMTVFYLPVGVDPVLAVFTVVFNTAVEAHRFHTVSGEILYLLEKRLSELIRRVTQQDRLERLTKLSTQLTAIAATAPGEIDTKRQLIRETAQSLTGAGQVYLVAELIGHGVRLAGEKEPAREPWLTRAGRLLHEAREDGWRVTLLSDVAEPRLKETCLLAVPATGDAPVPGMLLRAKKRRHQLDGSAFTEFDASLAKHLARLLVQPPPPKPAVTGPEPSNASPAPHHDAVPSTPPAGAPEPIATTQREIMLEILHREMDRCDRYHTTFALTAFRILGSEWDLSAAKSLAHQLGQRVRSSDFVTCLDDGTLLVIVPEDIQAISRQQRRLITLIREITGVVGLQVDTSSAIYPGRYESSIRLLDETLAALGKNN